MNCFNYLSFFFLQGVLKFRKHKITNLKPVKLQCNHFAPRDFQLLKAGTASPLSLLGRGHNLGWRSCVWGLVFWDSRASPVSG